MAARKTRINKTSMNGLSLDIEWGETDDSSTGNSSSQKARPGSRVMSSRASSSRSFRSSAGYGRAWRSRDQGFEENIQIIRDGFDDEDEWMVEEYASDDDGGHDIESMSSNSPDSNRAESYFQATQQQLIPFSQKYYGGNLQDLSSNHSNSPEANEMNRMALRGERRVAEVEVDTDEENDVVNKIRQEITAQIKDEIKSDAKNTQSLPPAEEEEELDPKIKEALLQMRKFDKILEKRTKRERRVKRERIALQRQLRQELEEIKQTREEGHKSSKDEQTNTEKFLSLPASITRFDRDVGENSDDDDNFDPLFQTQPPEYSSTTSTSKNSKSKTTSKHSIGGSSDAASQSTGISGGTSDRSQQRKRRSKKGDHTTADGKDFIQRNIDLAADAGNTIAMTDDEKKRLADILEDLNEMDNSLPEEGDKASMVPVKPGEGFYMDIDSRRQMTDIDRKLEGILGEEQFSRLLEEPPPLSYESLQLFSRTHDNNNAADDDEITRIGEKALQETRDYREQQKRLGDIEKELAALSTAVQSEIESPRLTENQLNVLLSQCRETMSKATAETDSLAPSPRSSQSSARAGSGSLAVRPHLDESVLKSLLDQARAEGIRSRTEGPGSTAHPDDESEELLSNSQREKLLVNPRSTSRSAPRPPTTLPQLNGN